MSGARATNLEHAFWVGAARASGGAIFFGLPLLMTEEMWWLGFSVARGPLILLMLVTIPLLVGLSHFSGFKPTATWLDDAVDAVVAYGVGTVTAAVVLLLLGIIRPSMPAREIVGMVALQAVPASFGAALAASQFHDAGEEREAQEEREPASHAGELFLMVVGALFLAFNIAPTLEMRLIAYRMTHGHALALVLVSLLLMHAFVYSVRFRGSARRPEGVPWWSLFLRYTVSGYALSLLVCGYVLWTFGRLEGHDPALALAQVIVLGFPAALGAAAARLVL